MDTKTRYRLIRLLNRVKELETELSSKDAQLECVMNELKVGESMNEVRKRLEDGHDKKINVSEFDLRILVGNIVSEVTSLKTELKNKDVLIEELTSNLENQSKQYQERIDVLTHEHAIKIECLESQLQAKNEEIGQLTKNLNTKDRAISELKDALAEKEELIVNLENQSKQYQERIDVLTHEHAIEIEYLKSQLQAKNEEMIEIELNSDVPISNEDSEDFELI